MRVSFVLAPALILTTAAFSPAASAKTCSKICNNPAAHARPVVYQPARPVYKKADHSHVRIYNGTQHGVTAGRTRNGVRVLTPAPLYNPQQQAVLAASISRSEARAASRELANTQARLALAQQAEASARLSAIEAKQDLILERQRRRAQPQRRVFFGNNRFFGRNGFIGNSNFKGATVPTGRSRIKSKKQRGF